MRGKIFCENHVAGDKPIQQKKVDKRLCVKCGLHQKNPLAATSGCTHEYPS
jgi:hypothetical protein